MGVAARVDRRMTVRLKRIYEKTDLSEGKRVLVDRLWPRGVKKSTANIDLWMKNIAPSDGLRKWFSHDPAKWAEFRKRYSKELEGSTALEGLLEMARLGDVTLVYSAKDQKHNNAEALKEIVDKSLLMV